MCTTENDRNDSECIAFEGDVRIALGPLPEVAKAVKETVDRGTDAPVLVFDSRTSKVVEIDLRGSVEDVLERLAPAQTSAQGASEADKDSPPRRGRPKLGVVGKEVTLLPRHWQWLGRQPGGASVTLRKLVDRARKENAAADRRREAQNAAYGFMSAMAGNQPGFEEATRALFAQDPGRFEHYSEPWPVDVRDHARALAAPSFPASEPDA